MKNKMIPWRKRQPYSEDEWRGDPFDLLQREVNELFDTYYTGGRNSRKRVFSAGWELSETDDEFRIKVELPGMEKEDIQIHLEDHMLTIRGEHKEETEKKKRNYHIAEMSYGGYSRTIPLPAKVDSEKADAKFRRGVLTLKLPKTAQSKIDRKRISVSTD